MSEPSTWLVIGPSGAGKTRWIAQQLQQNLEASPVYFHLGGGSFPLDATLLSSQFPNLTVLEDDRAATALVEYQAAGCPIYIEVGFHIALQSLQLPLNPLHSVAIAPPTPQPSQWSNWADETVTGLEMPWDTLSELQRLLLTSEVLDPASLDVFWQELTLGAYGDVKRAKGIFNLADGRVFTFQYVERSGEGDRSEYTELNRPRTLDGRPQQFSGLEIVGNHLDRAALTETLQDSCLSDATLSQYQAYLKTETQPLQEVSR
ncbi:GTP-binding protein [Baaleninema sp.]|uniref:GTP-binding protein n=1 Tax=Baaleninema sp. TaxID=3101197 RepID=UPI003CFE9875